MAEPEPQTEYDAFISYASEDKSFVEKLVPLLRKAGLKVFWDMDSMGQDYVNRSIDQALTKARAGIPLLSHKYFEKGWASRELAGMIELRVAGQLLLIPLWHGLTKDDVLRYSPTLKAEPGIRTSLPIEQIAKDIIGRIQSPLDTTKRPTLAKSSQWRLRTLWGAILGGILSIPWIGRFFTGRDWDQTSGHQTPPLPPVNLDTLLFGARKTQDSVEAALLLAEIDPRSDFPEETPNMIRSILDNRPIPSIVLDHPDVVLSARFSNNTRFVVTACSDQCVRVWASEGGCEPAVFRCSFDIKGAAFSPKDGWITGIGNSVASVWNWKTPNSPPFTLALRPSLGETLLQEPKRPNIAPLLINRPQCDEDLNSWAKCAIAIYCNDRYVAYSIADGLSIFSLRAGKEIWRRKYQDPVSMIKWASAGENLCVMVPGTGRSVGCEILEISEAGTKLLRSIDSAKSIAFAPTGDALAIQHNDSEIETIDPNTLRVIGKFRPPEQARLTTLSPCTFASKVSWSGSEDVGGQQTLVLYESVFLPNGKSIASCANPTSTRPHLFLGEVSPDGKVMIYQHPLGGSVAIHALDGPLDQVRVANHFFSPHRQRFAADARSVLTLGERATVLEFPRMNEMASISMPNDYMVHDISPDLGAILTTTDPTRIDLWNTKLPPLLLTGDVDTMVTAIRKRVNGILSAEARINLLGETAADAIARSRSRALVVRSRKLEDLPE